MPLFKSSKNQSASAATTPAATPRSSMQQQRPTQAHQMTQEQALKILFSNTMGNASSGPYIDSASKAQVLLNSVIVFKEQFLLVDKNDKNDKNDKIDRNMGTKRNRKTGASHHHHHTSDMGRNIVQDRRELPNHRPSVPQNRFTNKNCSLNTITELRRTCALLAESGINEDERGVAAGVVAAEADWFLEDLNKGMQSSNQAIYQIKTTSTSTFQSIAMPLFKSSKNQSASAATTPAATPRSSMQQQRPAQAHQMTQEQALKILLNSTMGNASSGPYIG
ncbi:MAG: hypothetical protein J3Q66DRAFT_441434 [Benniella sp.]|nr:MAG: hypothetical protein J3Q66DRAFT_441434 [Benniella sp.]